jgi:hypothetical protein
MEILLIIVIGVIISIVSAAGKKKPNQSSEDVPVRPNMSDIQKAFMMSSDMEAAPRRETQNAATQAAARKAYTKPAALNQTIPEKATERLSARTFETTPAMGTGLSQNKYANIDLDSFQAGKADTKTDKPLQVKKQQRSTLSLFEDKDDFVRAVIYSEILTRKAR